MPQCTITGILTNKKRIRLSVFTELRILFTKKSALPYLHTKFEKKKNPYFCKNRIADYFFLNFMCKMGGADSF